MARRNQGPKLRWLAKRSCYYITWTEGGRSRQRSTGQADREQAEIAFGEWLQGRGRHVGPCDPAAFLVTEALTEYAEAKSHAEAADRIGYAILPLTDFWQGKSLSEVTPRACRQYAEWRDRAAGTVRRELGVLRSAINLAAENARITRAVSVKLPDSPPPRDRWLTREEAAAIIRAARTPQARLYLPLFVLMALYTGRRKEAILSLRWTQVNLETKTIDFEKPGRTRTKKRRGKIPIPPRLLPHLCRARRRGTDLGYVLNINGAPIKDIKIGFSAACKRAGLEASGSDRITPHTLKHTAISWAMQSGADVWRLAEYFATSMQTLLSVYGHHHPEHLRRTAEQIGMRPQNVRVTA